MMADHDRFVRWQAVTMAQFGAVNNAVIGLATAALGFALTQARGPAFSEAGRWALAGAILILLISVACGLGCAVSRLLDFRETAKTARSSLDGEKAASREHAADLGKATWRLLYGQLASFAVGVLSLVYSSAVLWFPN